ncbi:regulator of G protein signaling domain-containing protein [Pholiota molesta]|nr:regulator of G protein signaling domain-containing protein [Pholiota molesta]
MPALADTDPQSTSSHMMKTTKRGRPFLKDTLDLFATLIVSLQLGPHKQFFRTFPHSFSTDEAAQNLASLKFSQSNRGPDPREPSRVVTTTTTTTFSMTRDMAKAMSQHFMDARLIENATDPSSNLFKDRGTYQLTPKGLHVLERFISKNGINADHLQPVFSSQPICIKLLHLERPLFRRFVGRAPNYPPPADKPLDVFQKYNERSKGIALSDLTERPQPLHCFPAVTALEWLCDFTSVVGREEAAEMAAQFVRFGLVTLVSDKRKNNDSAIIFTVRGSTPGGNSPVSQQGEFRCTAKAIYKITDEGRRLAHWDENASRQLGESPSASTTNLVTDRSSVDGSVDTNESKRDAATSRIHRRISLAEKLNSNYDPHEKKSSKESNTDRLRYIVEEPGLRSLTSFWLDVQDFKKKFNITSSAMAATPTTRPGNRNTPGQAAMERHHESLINTAFVIYNTYLAPSSQCELNIDHGLRNELSKYLEEVVTNMTGKAFQGRIEPEQANAFNATQLQTMIRLYERIQTHVFRLMATDSVPKFIKTPKFLAMRNWVEDFDPTENDIHLLSNGPNGPSSPPGLSEEVGGAYMTVSQQASEREHRQQVALAAANSTPSSP